PSPQAQSKPSRHQAGGFLFSGRRRARTSGGLKTKTAVRSTRFALGLSHHIMGSAKLIPRIIARAAA
ncbi:MAG TPA: hypothetical protein PKE03_11080, partial [Bacteroidales bacterium]|nr:hypothetical protein [Bacteroidales bacterium]